MVRARGDILRRNRFPEARPSCTRIKLGVRAEQRCSAAYASVKPLRVLLVVLIRERTLCAGLTSDVVLIGSELPLPFRVALDHLGQLNEAARRTGIGELKNPGFGDGTTACGLGVAIRSAGFGSACEADLYRERQHYPVA